MASSRLMRRSPRTASPLGQPTKDSSAPELISSSRQEIVSSTDSWVEPPLRAPAPSFEDHKGLERHGVLEHMAPLGTLPNQKLKLRVKQYDPNKRKNGDVGVNREVNRENRKPDSTKPIDEPVTRRKSESHKVEERPSKIQPPREIVDDPDYSPADLTKKLPFTPKSTSTSRLSNSLPKTIPGQERLREVVEAAVARAKVLNNEGLGLALRKLFEESLTNRAIADLLDAVLSQRLTDRQTADFQAYVKLAKKQIKTETSSSRRSSRAELGTPSKSKSMSPHTNTRNVASRRGAAPVASTPPEKKTSKPPVENGTKTSATNGATEEPPAKRAKRSKSISSTSSLSSLSSIEDSMELDQPNVTISTSTTTPKGKTKPQMLSGPKLHTFSTRKSTAANKSKNQQPATLPGQEPYADDLPAAEIFEKRRKMKQKKFDGYLVKNSSVRAAPKPEPNAAVPPPVTLPSSLPSLPSLTLDPVGPEATKSEDFEDLSSPVSSALGELLIPPPPGVQRLSRACTPNQLSRPYRKDPTRKAARIKTSPMKKRNGVIAGIARAGGGRDSPVGYEQMDENGDVDNVDFCTACGGNGQLLCCDGCTSSFHFRCLDPPMNPRHPPEGAWFCFKCESHREPQPRPSRGLVSRLEAKLKKHNPVAFSLPLVIRDYFEGVKTGEEGEYEETSNSKASSGRRTTNGYDETQDNFKLKDSKGNVVLCFKCGKSSMGHREIIACDYCTLRWHLDCLDPPMANPPVKDPTNRQKYLRSWMCPAHVDQELMTVSAGGGRMLKLRRPKNATIVDVALRRGFTNNGIIEIQNDPSSDEEMEERVDSGPEPSVVFRLTEQGIKLDFIDRVKRSHLEAAQAAAVANRKARESKLHAAVAAKEQARNFHSRSVVEQEAASTLAQLAQSHAELEPDQVRTLVATLIAEAPDGLVVMCDQSGAKNAETSTGRDPSVPPTPPISDQQERGVSTKEKQYLLLLQELIGRRLAEADGQED